MGRYWTGGRLDVEAVLADAVAAGKFSEERRGFWRQQLLDPRRAGLALSNILDARPVLAASGRRGSGPYAVRPGGSMYGAAMGSAAASPLLAEYQRTHANLVSMAIADGPPPELFGNGALPRETASGIDPQALAGVPWQARRPIWAEPNRAKASQMLDDYSGQDSEVAAMELQSHPQNSAYVLGMTRWMSGQPTDKLPLGRADGAPALAAGISADAPAPGPADDALYSALFGDG